VTFRLPYFCRRILQGSQNIWASKTYCRYATIFDKPELRSLGSRRDTLSELPEHTHVFPKWIWSAREPISLHDRKNYNMNNTRTICIRWYLTLFRPRKFRKRNIQWCDFTNEVIFNHEFYVVRILCPIFNIEMIFKREESDDYRRILYRYLHIFW